jgi:hypothetical protein
VLGYQSLRASVTPAVVIGDASVGDGEEERTQTRPITVETGQLLEGGDEYFLDQVLRLPHPTRAGVVVECWSVFVEKVAP